MGWEEVREEPQVNPTYLNSFPGLPFPVVLSSSLPGPPPRHCNRGGFCFVTGFGSRSGGTVRFSFPPGSPLRTKKCVWGGNGTFFLEAGFLGHGAWGSRSSARGPQTQAFRVPRSQGAPQPHLTLLVHGARSAPSSGAAAAGFPKARARGAGLRPRSASGVLPASGFGRTFPKLFVHRREGPRSGVCPGERLGPSPCPGPRPSARPRFSPSAGPRVGPAVALCGGLGPGGGAGLGPALSAGPGARETSTYLPWPVSVSQPGSDPWATIHHKFPGQAAKPGGGGGTLTCAHAH